MNWEHGICITSQPHFCLSFLFNFSDLDIRMEKSGFLFSLSKCVSPWFRLLSLFTEASSVHSTRAFVDLRCCISDAEKGDNARLSLSGSVFCKWIARSLWWLTLFIYFRRFETAQKSKYLTRNHICEIYLCAWGREQSDELHRSRWT